MQQRNKAINLILTILLTKQSTKRERGGGGKKESTLNQDSQIA